MSYEFNGEAYKKASAHQEEWGKRLINELNMRGDEAVLDLGCGDGRVTAQLADLLPNGTVIGIDASKGMIESAKQLMQANLSFELMDINEISYVNQFDLIFSNAALHWVLDHDTLLANCFKALKDGGRLRFDFGGYGNCANFYGVVSEVMHSERFAVLFSSFEWPWYMPSVSAYEEKLAAYNTSFAKVWEENADRYFENPEAITRWIDQPCIVPFLTHLPDAHKQSFRDAVVAQVIEQTRQDDGRCFETFRRVNVLVRK